MNKFSSVILAVVFTVLVSLSTFAQPAAQVKIGLINTGAFGDEKSGITKYISAVKKINADFASVQTELETMNNRLTALSKEIQAFQDQAAKGTVPIEKNAAQAKVDEAEKLQRDIKFKSEDAKARYEKRQQVDLGPVTDDIGKGIDEFAKKNGYGAIFDVSKLAENGILLFLADGADVTKEFVTFYNARTVTVAPPK